MAAPILPSSKVATLVWKAPTGTSVSLPQDAATDKASWILVALGASGAGNVVLSLDGSAFITLQTRVSPTIIAVGQKVANIDVAPSEFLAGTAIYCHSDSAADVVVAQFMRFG